ncbi:MAG: hypothetical protein D6722_10365 [Bacteroidetes bacterium]|nr:MAG: hypothetical protein D6722_10365 [Bacteroidota bacterium]
MIVIITILQVSEMIKEDIMARKMPLAFFVKNSSELVGLFEKIDLKLKNLSPGESGKIRTYSLGEKRNRQGFLYGVIPIYKKMLVY